MFEFLEEKFGIGVALQIQGLKQKVGLGELIYDLAKGKLGNPDKNSEKFNQQVLQFWTKKYQLEAIERPKPYDENENISSRSVTPQGHLYPHQRSRLSVRYYSAPTIRDNQGRLDWRL